MTSICYELVISVREDEKETLTDILNEAGETDFVEGAVDCDIDFDYDELREIDYYKQYANDLPVVLYSEDLARLEKVAAYVREQGVMRLGRELTHLLRPIADQNWRESWKQSFRPLDVAGVFCVFPPWEDPAQFVHPHKIVIDPGMAFGTGQHETTQLCLELLIPLQGVKRVLDVGTGSGILAIAARMRGAGFVLGNDIDPESVEIARDNAAKNGVSEVQFTAKLVHEIKEDGFDLLFANIQNKPLRNIMKDIVARGAPHAKFLISGILATEMDEFGPFLVSQGLKIISTRQKGAWMGIFCERA